MSHPFPRRTLALAGLTAAALGTAAAPVWASVSPPPSGADLRLTAQCSFPLIGELPFTFDLDAALPATFPTGQAAPGYLISATVTGGTAADGTTVWRGLKIINTASLSGDVLLGTTINGGGIDNLPVDAALVVAPYTLPTIQQDVVLTASGSTPPLTFPQRGRVDFTLDTIRMNLRALKADGSPVILPDDGLVRSDDDRETFDVPCTVDPGQDRRFGGPIIDLPLQGPTRPGGPEYTTDARGITLNWAASTDDEGIAGYDVFRNGTKIGSTAGDVTTLTLPAGSVPNGTPFTVQARDTDGLIATSSPTTYVMPIPADQPPSKPGRPSASEVGGTTATLNWAASTGGFGGVGLYEVLRNGEVIAETGQPRVTLLDLTLGTEYCVTVRAIENRPDPNRSEESEAFCFTTTPPMLDFIDSSYAMVGNATIKTLTKGVLPLRGSIDATIETQTGQFSADLALAPTKARLTALGFIPVTASVAFVTNGKTTGTLTGKALQTTSNVRIKLPQVSLFGTIPLAGGATCQTKALSKVELRSTNFDPSTGGTLAGGFAISNLSGCGALNGLVSPLTAGGGNTISLALAPNGAPAS